MSQSESTWQFWIDVGGTFTDCVFQSPTGIRESLKVLSSGVIKGRASQPINGNLLKAPTLTGYSDDFFNGFAIRFLDELRSESTDKQLAKEESLKNIVGESVVEDYDSKTGEIKFQKISAQPNCTSFELYSHQPAPLLAIRRAIGLSLNAQIPDISIYLGTTRGTNALLTRRGAKTALITTLGFRDILEIGDQARPKLFEINIKKFEPLYEQVIEVNERIFSDGSVEKPIDDHEILSKLQKLKKDGIQSIAICLMHGFRYDQHEKQIEEAAKKLGFAFISRSSKVAPMIKMVPRGETTVLDAYLNPLLQEYIESIAAPLSKQSRMFLMTSSGSLTTPDQFGGKESTLSGPAGGVVGMAETAKQAGFDKSIGLDMGGTSTDVSRFDGLLNIEYATRKAGIRIFSPTMAIETVAAGGGSICKFDGTRLQVGPDSAGADPGPACYGRNGPLTVTDVNLFLERISRDHFPFPLDVDIVKERLDELCKQIKAVSGTVYSPVELAKGFFEIANVQMASAVRAVSLAKGFDVREYTLVGFGGAAGQHLCAVADQLEITKALVHPQASLLSAVGISLAKRSAHATHSLLLPLADIEPDELKHHFFQLENKAKQKLISDGIHSELIQYRNRIEVRYQGTESYIPIEFNEGFVDQFFNEHQRQYGYQLENGLEIGAIHTEAYLQNESPKVYPRIGYQREIKLNASTGIAELASNQFSAGDYCNGPVRIHNEFTSIVVDPGWRALRLADGQFLLESDRSDKTAQQNSQLASRDQPDPVLLEVFNNHFTSIAEQMGTTLQKTSMSVNVKERLDFSCAVFNELGELVVNAPHIPVHLGAMSETVKATIDLNKQIRPGDIFVTNNPYEGGSHLPDVTVVTPVFIDKENARPSFFVASRSHHAEIGGISPGSMPPDAKNLAEEGVLISNFKIAGQGVHRFDRLKEILCAEPYPTRSVKENIADINAQIAANQQGINELEKLVEKYSYPVVKQYMRWIQDSAEAKAREAFQELAHDTMFFKNQLDNGAEICLAIRRKNSQLEFDFTGTSETCTDSHNANRAIVSAAIMYCVRCLIGEDIPLNEGLLQPVNIVLPKCFLNPEFQGSAETSPPVAAGNVETSQRVVDVILGALELAAASQGTMNNLLIGDDSFGYYETICGGAGATADSDGASVVHTHMTNTRLTDPEIVETRFPLRLRRFEIRRGSGGEGTHRGGDGVIREIEALSNLHVSILSNRRGQFAPFGLCGGGQGTPGKNWLVLAGSNEQVNLSAQCKVDLSPGDRIIIETPGGGGYGSS